MTNPSIKRIEVQTESVKLALVATAGMAVFAMSCSENGEDPGGKWTKDFDVRDDKNVSLIGEITPNDGVKVTDITVKADGVAADFNTGSKPSLPAEGKVDLKDSKLKDICVDKTGKKDIKFEITVKFDNGDDLTANVTKEIDCGGSSTFQSITKSVELSNSGNSYLLIDTKKDDDGTVTSDITTSKKAGVSGKEELVAAVAYYSVGDDKIYSAAGAREKGYISDFEDSRMFESETKCKTGGNGVENVAISDNATFILEDNDTFVWKVTITGTSTNSVTIKLELQDYDCGE